MHRQTFNIEDLSLLMVNRHWRRLVYLDRPYVRDSLLERWDYEHFSIELPQKWVLSKCALAGDEVVGYRVVSCDEKLGGYAHAHRICVSRDEVRKGIGAVLLRETHKVAKSHGCKGVTSFVAKDNERSKRLLVSHGYEYCDVLEREKVLLALTF